MRNKYGVSDCNVAHKQPLLDCYASANAHRKSGLKESKAGFK